MTNLRRLAEFFSATRTPTLMGFLCLRRLDECSSVSQMPPETTVGGTLHTCASNSSFFFPPPPPSYPERRPRLKRDCTSLPCSVFPQCTWSTLSRPSPTPLRWWWCGVVGGGGCKYTRSSERRRLPAIGAHAYVLARAERA